MNGWLIAYVAIGSMVGVGSCLTFIIMEVMEEMDDWFLVATGLLVAVMLGAGAGALWLPLLGLAAVGGMLLGMAKGLQALGDKTKRVYRQTKGLPPQRRRNTFYYNPTASAYAKLQDRLEKEAQK
jgi:hypothetical protein